MNRTRDAEQQTTDIRDPLMNSHNQMQKNYLNDGAEGPRELQPTIRPELKKNIPAAPLDSDVSFREVPPRRG